MRAVIQRVSSASVTVDSKVVSSISNGLMCLIGIGDDSEYIVNKILSLKVFDDPATGAMWKKSVKDIEGEILCVSQFTLMAKTIKGAKPDFHKAMVRRHGYSSGMVRSSDNRTVSFRGRYMRLCSNPWGVPIFLRISKFGAMMSVSLTNEGPVTITIDSRKFEYTPIPETGKTKKPAEASSSSNTPAQSN